MQTAHETLAQERLTPALGPRGMETDPGEYTDSDAHETVTGGFQTALLTSEASIGSPIPTAINPLTSGEHPALSATAGIGFMAASGILIAGVGGHLHQGSAATSGIQADALATSVPHDSGPAPTGPASPPHESPSADPAAHTGQTGGQKDDQIPTGPSTPSQHGSPPEQGSGRDGAPSDNGHSTGGSQPAPDGTPAGDRPDTQPGPKPHYESAPAITPVVHDGVKHFDAAIFMGIDPKQAPPFIRITAIEPRMTDGKQPSATLILGKGSTTEKVLAAGAVIALADFDRLSWDTSDNAGGRFSFVPLDGRQQPIDQIPAQTVEVHEHPEPPRYPDPATTLPQPVAHDAVLSFSALTFTGLDPDKAPAAIRITRIDATGRTSPDTPALVLLKRDGTHATLKEGAVVLAEDFSHVQWQTAGNEGGHFSFQPLADDGLSLAGSSLQNISIAKHPPPPSYAETPPVVEAAPERQVTLDAAIFVGSDTTRKPAGIRILAIEARDPTSPDAAALTLAGHADPVTDGWFIRAEDFHKLRWDASLNQGGRLQFIPANADGTPILGASPQTVLIEEASTLPAYEPYPEIWITHDATVAVDPTLFSGTNPHAAPFFARLGSIYGGYSSESPLQWRNGDSLRSGDLIRADQFDQLIWRGDLLAGGFFFFTPESPDGTALEGAQEVRIDIRESALPPVYPDPLPSIGVAHDGMTPLPIEQLGGIQEDRSPARIQINEISPLNPEGDHPALWLISGQTRTPVHVDDVIEQSELVQLHWDSRYNSGGTLRFSPLSGASDVMLTPSGEVVQPTLHIHELSPTGALPGNSLNADESDAHLTHRPDASGDASTRSSTDESTTSTSNASTGWTIPWKGVDASLLLDELS